MVGLQALFCAAQVCTASRLRAATPRRTKAEGSGTVVTAYELKPPTVKLAEVPSYVKSSGWSPGYHALQGVPPSQLVARFVRQNPSRTRFLSSRPVPLPSGVSTDSEE